MNKENLLLPASILLAALIISGSIFYGRTETKPQPDNTDQQVDASLEITDRDIVLGDANAPVTLITYGDYQCPFCARFYDQVEKKLIEDYVKTGKMKLVYRNFIFLDTDPTTGEETYYKESHLAAEAVECAREQGKFWDFHDLVYEAELKDGRENNGNLNKDLFVGFAKQLSLDEKSFTQCFDSRKHKDLMKQDTEAAVAVGVASTPTSFINGKMYKGVNPSDPVGQYKAAIDRELQER